MKHITVIFLFLLSAQLYSQNMTAVQYSVGFGTGDLGSYISKPSFRGATIDFRSIVQTNLGVGFEVGWNTFYEGQSGETYSKGNLSYSGNQYRYTNQFPVLFAVDYYLESGGSVKPFAGLGIGTMYTLRETDMNLYRLEEDAWNFALRPEIGVALEMNPETSFLITGKYYHGFEAGDLPTQSYFALAFGFVLKK